MIGWTAQRQNAQEPDLGGTTCLAGDSARMYRMRYQDRLCSALRHADNTDIARCCDGGSGVFVSVVLALQCSSSNKDA